MVGNCSTDARFLVEHMVEQNPFNFLNLPLTDAARTLFEVFFYIIQSTFCVHFFISESTDISMNCAQFCLFFGLCSAMASHFFRSCQSRSILFENSSKKN